jgi:hypothetical protein
VVSTQSSLYSTPDINLLILVGATGLSAVVFFFATRPGWSSMSRNIALLVGVLLATVAFSTVGVYMFNGYSALLIIAAGLLALAWLERSLLLGITGVVFSAAALLTNLYDMSNLFYDLGWRIGYQTHVNALEDLLLPAAVLLIGGVVAILTGRGATR